MLKPLSPLTAAADSPPELQAWRAELVHGTVRAGVLLASLPAVLALVVALRSDQWLHAVVTLVTLIGFAATGLHPRVSPRIKAIVSLVVLHAMGLWLLTKVSAAGPLYLLACPVAAMLMLGRRAALVTLASSTLSLGLTGWWLDIALPTVTHGVMQPALKWLNFGANFAMLALLLTLSCAFLLRRLESALLQQREVAASLRASEMTLREVASQVPGMVFRVRFDPQHRPQFLYVSPGAKDLLGMSPEALRADASLLARRIHPQDRRRLLSELAATVPGDPPTQMEMRVHLPGGQLRWTQVQSTAVRVDEQGVLHNGVMVDITARKANEALVWQQAHLDPLTGLPNRLTLQERLAQHMALSADPEGAGAAKHIPQRLALMLIDLDGFKEVNDTLGHATGDWLLVQAAQRLRACVPEPATVVRMGGDEFTVLMAAPQGSDAPDRMAQELLARLSEVFVLGQQHVHISASIGIALYPDDAADQDELLKHADQAMYKAKDGGRNRWCRFTPALQASAQQRMRLVNDLRDALAKGQLSLVYQPIVSLGGGPVRKAEALLRWQHPELGAVSPAEFIPIAESTGLIGPIGDWVLATAARQALRWRECIDPGFQISVNRSPLQFKADARAALSWPAQLAQLGVPASAIIVEITEGVLLDSGDSVQAQLAELRSAGMTISLDDFGTGYSALAYLQRFDIDTLKIDRSFVSGMSAGETGRKLSRAMVLMAHELGMDVVAEGVETQNQRDWLRAAGCNMGQGWLFARPMAPEAFEAWLGLPGGAAKAAPGANPPLASPMDPPPAQPLTAAR